MYKFSDYVIKGSLRIAFVAKKISVSSMTELGGVQEVTVSDTNIILFIFFRSSKTFTFC
jgi:hypothetical protein